MPLQPGTRLGPYEIVAPLGAGGMGEVHRARDTRLGRDVALKTLPSAFARDPDRRARFEREARAVAALSHPNVLAIHDIGTEGDLFYVVLELVEGVTLRERLVDGPLSSARAVPIAVQIAHGLAAAHDRGVVHRDLKPENVMITPEGRAKILDFGIAKLEGPDATSSHTTAKTEMVATEPGMLLGTVGYMAPEQVRGQEVDARSDLFALGAMVYEVLSGRRAFRGESPAETLSAILREDPPELVSLAPEVSPALERIVARCLEKQPVNRFRSAADLAFALEAISSPGSGGTRVGSALGPALSSRPTFRRLTFRNGHVTGARFTPDGAGVVYGAAWDGRPYEIFSSRTGSPESRNLGLPPGSLLSMSATGEMAVSLSYHNSHWFQVTGTLARVALAGGGMRPVQKDVGHADWSPDGKTMAIIRYRDRRCLLEYPSGNMIAEDEEWLGFCRVSPDGRHVAFSRHRSSGEGAAELCVADVSGTTRVLATDITNLNGIAWSSVEGEVWWSGINAAQKHGIWSAGLDGSEREVHGSPVRVTLHDVRRDGGVLLSIDDLRTGLSVGSDETSPEVDLSWFDGSVAADLSADGSQVLFIEAHEAENPHYACYTRPFDGSPAVRLGAGSISRFSTDGEWVATVVNYPVNDLMLYPTGFGEPRSVPFEGIERVLWAGFHPDGQQLFLVGSNPDRPNRLYLTPIDQGSPRLLYDEEVHCDRFVGLPVSPDGDRVVLGRVTGDYVSYSVSANTTEPVTGLAPSQIPLRFDDSGRVLYVVGGGSSSRDLERLDLASGQRTPWRVLRPSHPMGVVYVTKPVVAADGSRYAYSFLRVVSNLYLVEGLS